ncbi:MAG TPA: hypothetical protein VFW83_03710 [Bryobacteraceae bacterium]|nr:hypothetical protein [Bryobacteraceae bacterium]
MIQPVKLLSRICVFILIISIPVFAQQPAQPAAPAAPVANLTLTNASLTEVIDQLARLLKINYTIDPRVKGSVTINTYGQTRNLDARNLLEMILRMNGAGMVDEGGVYHIVPTKDLIREPVPINQINGTNIPEDDQTMLNLVFLKYVTVDELIKVLQQFTSENAVIFPYSPAHLLFIMDSRRNMRRTMQLISLFDSDMFANQRVRLFQLKNARPSDVVKDLENVLKSISLDNKTSTVNFLPVDRISTLIAVAPNPGVFDTVANWLKKLDVPVSVTAGAVGNYVYHVKYGRADCLAIALSSLFGSPSGYGGGYGSYAPPASPYSAYASPYAGGYGGAYGGGYGAGGYGGAYGGYGAGGYGAGGYGAGGYGSPNSFATGFGGTGACGAGGIGGYGGAGYGYPSFGGYAAQAPAGSTSTSPQRGAAGVPGAAGQTGAAGTTPQEAAPRIVPIPLDNSLMIQADPEHYQSILQMLKQLDVPPRQILLEAKIYEVDLTDTLRSGLQYALQQISGNQRKPTFNFNNALSGAGSIVVNAGTLVDNSRELMAALSLNEFASHVHMVSEPSLIATDSIPAIINVGTQVPVATGSTTLPSAGGVAVTQSISAENTGVTLQVNARVNPSGIVTLIVNQEISGINSSISTGVSGSPAFNQQVVQTQITLQDGDTIAIGGTIQDSTTNESNGIPVLSRIPGLGALFGSRERDHTRSELIIFMTPHVIYNEENLIEASDELKSRVKLLRKLVDAQ